MAQSQANLFALSNKLLVLSSNAGTAQENHHVEEISENVFCVAETTL